jgi:HD-GYP domain-containing protein (c-di-GMP phosphodiesterase class II)
MAVADSYDAMTSMRPYRGFELSKEQAIEQLKKCAGKQFDATVVNEFVKILERDREVVRISKDTSEPVPLKEIPKVRTVQVTE